MHELHNQKVCNWLVPQYAVNNYCVLCTVKAKNVNKNLQNKNENRNVTACMEVTSRSFNVWVIYRIKTLEHIYLILKSLNEI